MIAVIDTNVLARFIVPDDPVQGKRADDIFASAKKAIVPTVVFCELAWLMRSRYKLSGDVVAGAIRGVLELGNVVAETDEVQAGLQILDDGGDFADGVVAYAGGKLAGERSTFVSFDKQAIKLMAARGLSALDAGV